MRWAFWRSSGQMKRAEERPLPEDVGLPAGPSGPAATADRDQIRDPSEGSAATPFSGASPDAAEAHVGAEHSWAAETGGPALLDPATAAGDAAAAAGAVRGVLSGDAAAIHAALSPLQDQPSRLSAAGALAVQALTARLPALSGVTGEVVFDEPADELLHAYADLLAERAEPLRRRAAPALRDEVSATAHLAAGAAAQAVAVEGPGPSSPDEPAAGHGAVPTSGLPRLVLPDLAPHQQLLAACVLLAQTCRDGGGDADDLAVELAALARQTPG